LTREKRGVTIVKTGSAHSSYGALRCQQLLRVQEVNDDRTWQREQFRRIAGAEFAQQDNAR
jgi:hypothetical protein